jgi:glutathione gamma-glutamylcysteinyltransferase
MKSSSRAVALCWRRLQQTPSSVWSTSESSALWSVATNARIGSRLLRSFSTEAQLKDASQEDIHTIPQIGGSLSDSYLGKKKVNGEANLKKGRTLMAKAKEEVRPCTCGLKDQKELQLDNRQPLPPPLPKPTYSVHKRVLPATLIALSSPEGRQLLVESLANQTAESYWSLTEQFVNQSDPAFCGVTTLLMVLNAMNMDPNVRWKGGWRYYGDEDVLLQRCCLNAERIRRVGITMEQFMTLGCCHGMRITMKRPAVVLDEETKRLPPMSAPHYTLEEFRKDIQQTLDSRFNKENAILVSSFSRAALKQTGDGHFSPIAAYHQEKDQVLILDVARFKYSPYWVSIEDLYKSMEPLDEATQWPRGWYIMKPPIETKSYYEVTSEEQRPAHLVSEATEGDRCPVGKIKVQFCPATRAAKQDESNKDDNFPKEVH